MSYCFPIKYNYSKTNSSGLEFRLREVDRSEREDNGVIEIVVEVANQRDLASSISLVLTPRVALESFTPKPSTTPFDRASTRKFRSNMNS